MKKYLSFILALIMAFALMGVAFAEGNTPTFVVSEATGAPGEEVQVTIEVQNNPGVADIVLTVEYDKDILEWTGIEKGIFTDGITFFNVDETIQWTASDIPEARNGLYATLTFRIKDNAPAGETLVTVSYEPDDVFDWDGNNVYFDIQDGKVTVTGETPSTTPTFVVSEATGAPGEEVQVTIEVQNNPGVADIVLTVEYDKDILEWTGIEKGIFTDGITYFIVDETIQWTAADIPEARNGLYATLTFRIKDNAPAGETPVTVSYEPDDVFDWDGNNVYFDIQDGKVTVTEAQKDEPAFVTQSLLLTGQIGVKFYMYLPQGEDVTFEYDKMVFEISSEEDAIEVPFSEELRDPNSGNYAFICYVRSIQMADTITATFYYTDDGEAKTLVKTYSVKEYILDFRQNTELFTDAQQDMVKAVADYGHYMQAFLDSTRDWTVGEEYAEMDEYFLEIGDNEISEAQEALAEYKIVREKCDEDIYGITFTLTMDSDSTLQVSFKTKKNYTGNISFTLDGEEITVAPVGKRYTVEIKNIAAHELSTPHTIIATTDNGDSTVVVSGISYAQAMMEAFADDPVALKAAVALYRYSKFADALKANQ